MRRKAAVWIGSLIVLAGCSGAGPDLGVKNGTLAPCPETPNCVNSQAADERHAIAPIRHVGSPAAAREDLRQLLAAESRVGIVANEDQYLRATFTSAIFRFVDDVEFYFRDESGGGTVIEVRSASRTGYWDFGANRRRIERLRRSLAAD